MKFGIDPAARRGTALAATVMLFAACGKPIAEAPVEEEAPATPAPAPAKVPLPLPSTPIAVVATPVPDPLAPPGVFFLLQKTSITTDDGIVGLKPGQVLRELGPGSFDAGGHTVQLRADQVTNNLRIARQFAAADAASQAALRQIIHATPVPLAATPAPRITSNATEPVRPRPPATSTNSLGSGSRLGGGTGVADPETSNRKNVRIDTAGRQYWRDSRGNIRYDF